jgi:two-component system cell cycle sensor histidine kinase/response regulator CckA
LDELEGRIDLILTDVVMPDMGGLELTGRVHERRPDLKVLYMSGYAEGDKLQPKMNSEHSFLQKPFSAESLTLKVREVLDRGN